MSKTEIELEALLALRRHAAAVDLTARRRVLTDLGGTRLSGFRGRGMEFEEHRMYQPGDEVRTIDWRVTARTGDVHVKVFREERERPVLLAVDLRAAMRFGTRGCFKHVMAAQAAALCGWAAEANGDRVGGLCFGDTWHTEVRPSAGRRGLLSLLRHIAAPEPQTHSGEDAAALPAALKRLLRTARGGSLVGLFSDFRGLDQESEDLLMRLGHQCELIIGHVVDPLDAALPAPGQYPIRTAQSRAVQLDAGDPRTRAQWQAQFKRRQNTLKKIAVGTSSHWLDLPTDQAVLDSLRFAFGQPRKVA